MACQSPLIIPAGVDGWVCHCGGGYRTRLDLFPSPIAMVGSWGMAWPASHIVSRGIG